MMNLVDVLCRDFPKFILHGEVALSISAPHIQPIFWLILATYYLKILLFFWYQMHHYTYFAGDDVDEIFHFGPSTGFFL